MSESKDITPEHLVRKAYYAAYYAAHKDEYAKRGRLYNASHPERGKRYVRGK